MKLDRRDFIRQSIGAILGLSLPLEFGATLTIVDVELEQDKIWQYVHSGEIVKSHGRTWADVESGKICDAVEDGNTWPDS